MSVGLLLCSPLSTGLFHKAISQSGSAVLPNVTPTNNKDRTYMLAKLLGEISFGNIIWLLLWSSALYNNCDKIRSNTNWLGMSFYVQNYNVEGPGQSKQCLQKVTKNLLIHNSTLTRHTCLNIYKIRWLSLFLSFIWQIQQGVVNFNMWKCKLYKWHAQYEHQCKTLIPCW